MRRICAVGGVILFVLSLTSSIAAGAADLGYREGELIVRFKEPTARQMRQLHRPMSKRALHDVISNVILRGSYIRRDFGSTAPGLTLVRLPKSKRVADALIKFELSPAVIYVEPNYKYQLARTPNDTRFGAQWALQNTGQTGGIPGADIHAVQAWDIDSNAPNIIVAVTDTGLDVNHPDVNENVWHNTKEDPNNGIDDDHNGYIDDVYGWDFAGADGNDLFDGDNSINDIVGHGTHVSGIIGAIGNNNRGIAGVCWRVQLMTLKIFADNGGGAAASDIISALGYAVMMKPRIAAAGQGNLRVINASWGGGSYSQGLYDAINSTNTAGILFVASAGNESNNNDTTLRYPSSYDLPNIISVMATNHNDRTAYYSNYGATTVDIGAPGGEMFYTNDPGGIISTIPGTSTVRDNYAYEQGTSMAAPHVSGAAAIVWTINTNWTVSQLKTLLLHSVDPVLQGLCVSGGRLNLYKAALEASQGSVLNVNTGTFYPSAGHPTSTPVQDAVNAAASGHTLIADSNHWYHENVDFKGKNILLRSGKVSNPGLQTIYPENTYISGLFDSGSHPVVKFAANEDANAVLKGFTIINGKGGGIDVNNATPRIQQCIITKNSGSGIVCQNGAEPNIIDCTIVQNTSGSDGGGISCKASSPWITRCTISDNNSAGTGGGIFCDNGSDPNISSCTISRNFASDPGGGIRCTDSSPDITNCNISANSSDWEGGGIYLDSSEPNITDCNIIGNISHWDGGGIFCNTGSNPVVRNSTIKANTADFDCGGIYCYQSSPTIKNNLLLNNTVDSWDGGGVFCWGGSPNITNCTFVNNSGNKYDGLGGAIYCMENSRPNVTNCIFKDNPDYAIFEYDTTSDPNVTYCLFYHNTDGDYFDKDTATVYNVIGAPNLNSIPDGRASHNIGGNPLFVTGQFGDFYLSQGAAGQIVDANGKVFDVNGNPVDANSPAVDAGSDLAMNLGLDSYSTRTDLGRDGDIVDIGFHYHAGTPAQYRLTLVATPTAGGTVTAIPTEPNNMYNQFVQVLLKSEPNAGYQLKSWQGTDNDAAVDANGQPVTQNIVTMSRNKTVTVTFQKTLVTFRARVIGGNGDVTPRSGTFARGTVVALTATPADLSNIIHWTGTDNDLSIERTNYVTMRTDPQVVEVSFYAPRTLMVTTSGGGDPTTSFSNIQKAIDAANPGDIVMIQPGNWDVYLAGGDYDFLLILNDITIRSMNPDDANVVASTIINGGFVIFNSTHNTIISGLTIRARYGWNVNIPESPSPRPDHDGVNGYPIEGGGMDLYGNASPTVLNCVFRDCSVKGVHGEDGECPDGDGGWGGWAHGGAVCVGVGGSPIFKNCQFIDCNAVGADGGNGCHDEHHPGHGGSWDSQNASWYYGPYLPYWKYSGYGGAVYCDQYSKPEFIDCDFVNNMAFGGSSGAGPESPWVFGYVRQHEKIDRFGGAVFCASNSTPTFTGCNFLNDKADVNGPALWHDGYPGETATAAYQPDSDVYLSYGGAIAYEDDAMPTFEDCTFNGNLATIGGAVYGEWGDGRFGDSNFVDNTAYHGGGIYVVGGINRVARSNIIGNQAITNVAEGGGIFVFDANMIIVDCNINSNDANGSGGGIFAAGSNTPLIKNCLITDNTAKRDGGGISVNWYCAPTISNCTIANNLASGEGFAAGYGGGVYVSYQSYAKIINSILWGNSADHGPQIAIGTGFEYDRLPADVNVTYSDIQGGAAGVYFDTGVSAGKLHWDYGSNLTGLSIADPLFIAGYYLSQPPPQAALSPCVDKGKGNMAADVNTLHLYRHTTRTDRVLDTGRVDIGYHYLRYADIVGDYDFNGKVDSNDLALFGQKWLYTGCDFPYWCDDRDLNQDGKVDSYDKGIFMLNYGQVETVPPNPNPMTWATPPYLASSTSVKMIATTAIDNSGFPVQYGFQRTDANGVDDGSVHWSNLGDANYTDTTVVTGRTYGYKVQAHDVKPVGMAQDANTAWSVIAYVTVSGGGGGDTTAPIPNPMTWLTPPYAISSSAIGMAASTASDSTPPVYYFFQNTTAGMSSHNSGWQTSQSWTDTGLTPSTTYSYRVQAKDSAIPANIGQWSTTASAMTLGGADVNAPTPDPMTWAVLPHSVSSTRIDMTATTASDVSGVQYQFERIDPNGVIVDSAWQSGTAYSDTTVKAGISYSYAVRARDNSPLQNTGGWSVYVYVDRTAPTPNPSQWSITPSEYLAFNPATGMLDYWHTMTAVTAADANGVEYYFACVNGGLGKDSGWQNSPTYNYAISHYSQPLMTYRVRTRDKSPSHNTGNWSLCCQVNQTPAACQ